MKGRDQKLHGQESQKLKSFKFTDSTYHHYVSTRPTKERDFGLVVSGIEIITGFMRV
jgi:hypothetical protein